MTDVFISYSRKDKAFVQVLNQALADSKYDAWVDWENIPLTADWWEEIKAGIEAADTFIFVISPDSIASKVCGQEIDHAVENNKRLLPIVYREGFDMSLVRPALGKHNWLFFKDDNDFDQAFASLVDALNTDLSHVKTHTRLLVRALEWEKKQRSDDFLLRGSDLKEAESWLTGAERHEPLPTEQHKNYVTKSRDVEDARQRLTAAGEKAKRLVRIGAGVLAGTIAIATVISIFTQRNVHRTRKLAEIEQDSINALQQFEYQQLDALVQAMKAAENLKDVMRGGDKLLRDYVPQSAPRVLQQILDQISLKNTFSNNPEVVSDEAVSVTFSPDGELLVITGSNGNVMLKTPQGIDIQKLEGHSQKVVQADFSPDGQIIGTTSEIFRLFDHNGKLLKTLEHPSGSAGRIRFSPDGQYIAISGWGKDMISLLDISGKLVTNIDAKSVVNIDFHPNKPILANGSNNGTIEIWDFQGNKISTLEGHKSYIRGIRFSPKGDYLVSGSADSSVRLWNLETQESKTIDDLDGWVFGADFHPDGEQFAASSSGGIAKVWDLDGNVIRNFPGHVGTINWVRFSPDGHKLATAADDAQIRVWSLKGKAVADLDGHMGALEKADFNPDGTHIVTASADGTTRIWDMSGREIRRLELPNQTFNNVVYSPDGNAIATSTAQGDIQLWDIKGNLVNSFAMHGSRVLGLDLSPDGQYGLSGSNDDTAKLWDLDGNVRTVVTHNEWIRDVAFSPDGQTFATASEDALTRLWDLEGNLLAEFVGHADGVNGISFSPAGKLVTASDDSTIKLWDLQGNLVHSFQKHHGRVWAVAFSPDGESIATGTSDGYARLWDLDGNLTSEFKGHEEVVTGVEFSPDGQHLVTTSSDGKAKVWQIARTLDDLLEQGCEWLADYLTIHPDALMDLESCQLPERLQQAAPYLIQKASQTAQAGKTQIAKQQLTTALTWNPQVDLVPETLDTEQNATQVARKFSATYELREGQRLANQFKLEEATQAYEKALEIDTEIDLDPKTELTEQDAALIARRYAAFGLRKRGQLKAQQLKIEAAIQIFKEALELNPDIDLNPDTKEIEQDARTMARRFSAPGYLATGQQHVRNGDIEAAVQAYKRAQDLDPDLKFDQGDWDTLCWFGSVHGGARIVRFACENEMAFGGVTTFDSKGIVLAIDGDIDGAISNFQTYRDYIKSGFRGRASQSQEWIDALRAGEDPFKL